MWASIVLQSSYSAYCNDDTEHVMLSTTIIHIMDDRGETHECRAVISDVGATDASDPIRESAPNLVSKCIGFHTSLTCLLIDRITSNIPNFRISESAIHVPPHITLADLQFWVPHDVDLIIGNDQLWDIMCVG